MAGAGGLGWPDPAGLGQWNALQEARAWVGVPDNVWEVLLRQTGMYDSALGIGAQTARIRDFAAIPPVPICLLYTSPSPRDRQKSRMPSSA